MIYILRKDNDVLKTVLNDIANLHPDKTWKIEVTDKPPTRSTQANALYWKWVHIIAEDRGYTDDELHDTMKLSFLGTETKTDITGKTFEVIKDSRNLNKQEFSEYMNKVHALAMSFEIRLPQPEHYGLEIR